MPYYLHKIILMSRKERLERTPEHNVIQIKAVTWNKDSHGLFDYESKNCLNQKVKFKASDLSIYRNKQSSQINVISTDDAREQDLNSQNSLLIRVFSQKQHGESTYFVSSAEKKPFKTESQTMQTEECLTEEINKEQAYLIVRSLKNSDGSNKGHVIEIGQKIKLGRMEYSVIEIKINQDKQVSDGSLYSFLKNKTKHEEIEIEIEEGANCKVCMEGPLTHDNFLFSPCKCSGTCKYIHLNCLKQWILSKVKKEVIGGTAYYHFDKFNCEICKQILPKHVVKNGHEHQLLEIDRPEGNYMILQEVGEHKKDLIVIKNIPADGINLGRGHQCEIRINDISVSRQHAYITLENNKFILYDKQSKFGTLVKLTKNLPIDNIKRAFQIGRTVLTFMMKSERLETKESTDATSRRASK